MVNIVADAFHSRSWAELPVYRQHGWSLSNAGTIPYLQLTVAFTVATFIFELYLDWRQLRSYETTTAVPKEIAGVVDNKVYQKSRIYGKEKLAFGILRSTFGLFEGILLLLLGFQPYLWDMSANVAGRWILPHSATPLFAEMVISAIFFILLTLEGTILSLPFSYYSTFVIEQKHGFNNTDMKTFVKDQLLGLALCFGIGSPVLAAIVWVIRKGGPHFYFYVWAFLFVVSLLFTALYPVLIAPLFNKYTKLEDSELYDAIKDLAKSVKFPLTNIFTVDGSKRSAHSNAYFYGFFKNKRIVIFDTLITQVTQSELLAILGHEIGHWKLWHTIQNFVITQVITTVPNILSL
jgi:STE24 endopeptidase